MSSVMVDVLMMTYNHEKFIAQAIEGVLMQQTNFAVRLLIGEDFSSDSTLEICKKYQAKHPDKIQLISRPHNVGPCKNFIELYNLCTAPYIALCEGDDYWTNPTKLQRQVDVLEQEQDCVICFHSAQVLSQDGVFTVSNPKQEKYTDIHNLINGWYINTATYVFRNNRKISFPEMFFKVKATDLLFHILIAENGGKIYFIDEPMAVYRRHAGGVTDERADYEYHLRKNIPFYELLIKYFSNNKFNKAIAEKRLQDIYNRLLYVVLYKKGKTLKNYLELIVFSIKSDKISLPKTK